MSERQEPTLAEAVAFCVTEAV
jgi:hypothetical protein